MTSQLHKFSRHLLLSILMLAGITLFSQNWINDLVEEGKPLNFYEIQKKANEYWTTHDPTEKGKGFKPYKRWENYWENRLMEDGTFPPAGITNRNFQKYLKSHPLKQAEKALAGANWTSIGPNSTDGGYAGIGRINAIAFHPTNNNIIYLLGDGKEDTFLRECLKRKYDIIVDFMSYTTEAFQKRYQLLLKHA